MLLNCAALWKQEPRNPRPTIGACRHTSGFSDAWSDVRGRRAERAAPDRDRARHRRLQHAGHPAGALWRQNSASSRSGATTALTAMLALGGGAGLDPRRAQAERAERTPTASPGSARCSALSRLPASSFRRRSNRRLLFGFGVGADRLRRRAVRRRHADRVDGARQAGRPRPRARRLGRRAGHRRWAGHRPQRRHQRRRLVAGDAAASSAMRSPIPRRDTRCLSDIEVVLALRHP